MEIIAGLSDHLGAFNALLTGPTGCGKTEFAIQLAARFGMPFLKMDCSVVREPERWFGNQYAKDGSTGWHTAEYIKAVEQGGCVILHDELNRVSEYVKNPLLGLFDDTRQVFLDIAGKTFHVGHGTIMLATMNEGAEFTGTGALDLAFQNRFGFRIETNYLNSDDETKVLVNKTGIDEASAKHLVEIASTIRGKSKGLGAVINQGLSTRQLLNAAHAFVHPKGGIAALQATIANHFDATGGTSSERAQVLTLLQGKFGADIQTIDAHTEDIVAADIS